MVNYGTAPKRCITTLGWNGATRYGTAIVHYRRRLKRCMNLWDWNCALNLSYWDEMNYDMGLRR